MAALPPEAAYLPAHHEEPARGNGRGIPWPAAVVILATPFLICFVGELGPHDGFALFMFWILSVGLLLGVPEATRIAAFVSEALQNYRAI